MTNIISRYFDHLVTHYDVLLADFSGTQVVFKSLCDDRKPILRPGVLDLLSAFHRARKPAITVSNSPASIIHSITDQTDLKNYIDKYFSGDWAMTKGLPLKPAPDLYEGAIISTQPQGGERYLIIEDSLPGIRAAFALQRLSLVIKLGSKIDVWQIYYDDLGERPYARVKISSPHTQSLSSVFQPVPDHGGVICPVCLDVLSLGPV